jgi:hypothetical protein
VLFKYGEQNFETVKQYKYLGIILNEHLDYSISASVLSESAGRALGGIISKFKVLKDVGYRTYTKMYEAGVCSIMEYCSEIWGFEKQPSCDNIFHRAIRYYLGVHRFIPTVFLKAEMGWIPPIIRRHLCMLRYWNRLLTMNENRLSKRLFELEYRTNESSWCREIESIFESMNMNDMFIDKHVCDLSVCKTIMLNSWKKEVADNVISKPKLRTYVQFMDLNSPPEYLTKLVPRSKRSLFEQFRGGILPLHIETGRFRNIKDTQTGRFRKLKPEERICTICDSDSIEDEMHFLMECNKYNTSRRIMFEYANNADRNFHDLNNHEKFIKLVTTHWKVCIEHLVSAWTMRKESMYIRI